MSAYIKKEGGKRYEKTGGKPTFGGAAKKSFGKKSWGDSRGSDGPVTHHKAICSKCGKSCEVPFKPVSGKPVFCRDCFVRTGDTEAGRAGDRFPKRAFQSRTPAGPAPESNSNAEVMKQLEKINEKLERLIRAVEASADASSTEQ